MSSESRHKLEAQEGLLSKLSSEKAGLINQVNPPALPLCLLYRESEIHLVTT